MATNTSALIKQYRDLVRNIESFTDGQGTVKHDDDSDSLDNVNVTFNIKGGLFRGAVVDFRIYVANGFPNVPPAVTCLTELYHPNLDFCEDYYDDENDGNVCLNLFDECWDGDRTLEDVVQGLLFLIHNPNLSDPLNTLFCGNQLEDDFQKNVRISLRGGTVDGVTFTRALPDGYESDFDNEEDDSNKPLVVPDVAHTEITQEGDPEIIKQDNMEPEISKVDQLKEEIIVPAAESTTNTAATSHRTPLLRNVFSNIGKLFTGYFLTRQNRRTIIESSVDPVNYDVHVT